MYGMNATVPASGAVLAYSGINVGFSLLTAVGVLMMGLALLSLVRRNGKVRP